MLKDVLLILLALSTLIFSLSHFLVVAVLNPVTKPIIDFCAGTNHACAVFNTNKMKCWGKGESIGLAASYGNSPSTVGDAIPYFNPGNSLLIAKVSCGNNGICVLLGTGNVKCVGENSYGQCGIGEPTSTNPIGASNGYDGDNLPVVNLGSGVVALDIVGSSGHNCVLMTDKRVKCYGRNDYGQLGLGNTTHKGALLSDMGDNLPYVDLGVGVEVASIHSGSYSWHTCIVVSKPIKDIQRIKCWGNGAVHQLGYGDTDHRGDMSGEMGDNLPLIDLGTESKVKHLAIGAYHCCAVLVNDVLKCWGSNEFGGLGSGSNAEVSSTGDSMPSVLIDSGKKVSLIAGGNYHTCIVYDDMTSVKCVGDNFYGQLGQGDQATRGDSPTTMIPFIPYIDLGTGSLKIASFYSGRLFNCIVFINDSVKCFGENMSGQLAIGLKNNVGDKIFQMSTNLTFSELFSPTQTPTKAPTRTPSQNPTKSPIPPTKLPTMLPTSTPTKPCDYQSAKLCKYDIKCMWKKVDGMKQCVVFACAGLNKAKCAKERTRCKWNKKSSTCDFKK